MEKNSVKERLIEFIKSQRLSIAKFQQNIGVSNSFVANICNSIGSDKIRNIERLYPQLNIDWLLSGTGEMLQEVEKEREGMIPVLPLSLVGASLDKELMKTKSCETIFCPIDSADFAVHMAGNEMYPIIPDGSYIICKSINPDDYINFGKVYVLDTDNGILVRFIYPSEKDNCIKCVCAADTFPDFDLRIDKVNAIYQALMSMHKL